jgi:hypothetical protein
VVVAAVGAQRLRPASWSTDAASHGRHPVEQLEKLRDVVAVAAGERPGRVGHLRRLPVGGACCRAGRCSLGPQVRVEAVGSGIVHRAKRKASTHGGDGRSCNRRATASRVEPASTRDPSIREGDQRITTSSEDGHRDRAMLYETTPQDSWRELSFRDADGLQVARRSHERRDRLWSQRSTRRQLNTSCPSRARHGARRFSHICSSTAPPQRSRRDQAARSLTGGSLASCAPRSSDFPKGRALPLRPGLRGRGGVSRTTPSRPARSPSRPPQSALMP